MTALEDVRKTIEAAIGNLTPAKAQELARSFADPGTAKEQVAKMAGDMLEWSQRNRDRMREFVGREIAAQMTSVGVATQSELDALKKRVRDLERHVGMTASGRRSDAKKSTAKATTAKKTTAKATTAKKSAARPRAAGSPAAPTGS
jgi:polyhydroxyalkanoate synthesis regulator phasin